MSVQFSGGVYRPNGTYFNLNYSTGPQPLGRFYYQLNPYAAACQGYYPGGKMTTVGLANAQFYNSLPLMYSTYGGDNQVSIVPPMPNLMTGATFNYPAQQITGTAAIYPNFTGGAVNPTQDQVRSDVAGNVEDANNSLASANIAQVKQGAKSLKSRINAALAKEDIEDDKKQALQALLEEVEALETEADNLQHAGEDGSTETVDSADAVSKSRKMLQKLNEINKKVIEATKAPAADNGDGNDDGNDDGDGND